MDPRKATASVSYNGKRIDTKLAEYLQSFSYTDVASGESDSLSLNINDRDRKWIKSWFPSKGDTMAATIIMKNWSKDLPGMICPWKEDYQDAKRVAVQLG